MTCNIEMIEDIREVKDEYRRLDNEYAEFHDWVEEHSRYATELLAVVKKALQSEDEAIRDDVDRTDWLISGVIRLRIGRYRVFFDFDGQIRIIAIQEVKKRDEHSY